ncbi:alpha/beta hydrolase [Hungatella hathewayi]
MAYFSLNMRSEYLRGNETVGIIMPDKMRTVSPDEFYKRDSRYKVLWLLHGGLGDYSDWIRKSNIELYACENNLVVVMPSAMNSQYSDWNNFAVGYDMYNFFFEELMPMVFGWLPISQEKKDNFIAGLSMGGEGVLKFVLNHPEKFEAASVMSWAPYEVPGDPAFTEPRHPWVQNMLEAHGGLQGFLGSINDTWTLTGNSDSSQLPRMLFTIGEKDEYLPRFMRYKEYVKRKGIDAEFVTVPKYGHEWRLWDLCIQKTLHFFGIDDGGMGNAF